MNEARIAELTAKTNRTTQESAELDYLRSQNDNPTPRTTGVTLDPKEPRVETADRRWNFTVDGDKDGAKANLAGQPAVNTHHNRRLQDAIALLIDAMPAGAIKVVVDGDLAEDGDIERERKIVITATSVQAPVVQKVELTEAEKKAGIEKKREQYQKEDADRQTYIDAGRYTRNDKGEVTDVNALPVVNVTPAERERIDMANRDRARR